MAKCALCLVEKELAESHIIPSFIFKWLKDTSVTGFIRDLRHGNRRTQDGYKTPLLCLDCEGIISRYENAFSLNIFKEFTGNYLDLSGRILKDGFLEYEEWLDKFIISIVWRSFRANFFTGYPEGLSIGILDRIDYLLEKWRRYLLGLSDNNGKVTSYLLFLRNIHEGSGDLPDDISPRIINYLMRSIDGALIMGKNLVIGMMKLGPIMIITAIQPSKIAGYPNSIVLRRGRIKIEQVWSNGVLNRYLFVDRPNELDKLRGKTMRQQEQVDKALEKNIDRIDETMSMHVLKSDMEKKA